MHLELLVLFFGKRLCKKVGKKKFPIVEYAITHSIKEVGKSFIKTNTAFSTIE